MASAGRVPLPACFDLLGRALAERGLFVEIAAGDGAATILLFEWGLVDGSTGVGVREAPFEEVLGPVSAEASAQLGLADRWLNDAVGLTSAPRDPAALFEAAGTYPPTSRPGLRVLVAPPAYLEAMRRIAGGSTP
jgi:3-methyladenine DNA glycosylase/8-oxoguanine DNA glycosylase